MCNGDDIITFAEKNGATKTAAKLQKSTGEVNITDLAVIKNNQCNLYRIIIMQVNNNTY